MKPLTLSIAMVALTQVTTARADEATLVKAIATYNQLPAKGHTLTFDADKTAPDPRATRIPAWLAQVGLTDREAAATAAAFGVYGNSYQINYRSRNWGTGASVAGYVAETVVNNTGKGRSNKLPDAGSNVAPSRELIEARRSSLLSAMKDMSTCSGALVRAVQKTAKVRVGDDATRLLAKAQRDLGAAALPPDDSCLS